MKKASKTPASSSESTEPPKPGSTINVTDCSFRIDPSPKFEVALELARAMGEQSKAYAELARALGAPVHSGHMLSIHGGVVEKCTP